MSQNSQDYASRLAIDLYMNGTPTLRKVIETIQAFDRERDKAWREQMEKEFCEKPHEVICTTANKEWYDANPEVHGFPASDDPTYPKPCDACLSIRGTSP